MTHFASPNELADYLQTKSPWFESFAPEPALDHGERCCLGHYADMCGLNAPFFQTQFAKYTWEDALESGPSEGRDDFEFAELPEDHWLLMNIDSFILPGVFNSHDGQSREWLASRQPTTVESVLTELNDSLVDEYGFEPVIYFLRNLS